MVVAQRVKEAEITEQDSLLLTRNLLRIAIFNISYIRGLFPENYFNDKSVPALEMKIKKLMPMDAESRRLIDWMEKGVYDALQNKYLKTLLFCICEEVEGPMIEEYAFSFSYASSNNEEVSMNVNRSGNKKNGATFKSNSMDITPDQMRSSACKMVRTLVQLMRTLDQMPGERTILMKLLYYDDVTPEDYEPPFFRCCSENEAPGKWTKNPLKMEVGNVNSKHFVLALKVKSVLDPCEDENGNLPEDEPNLGDESAQDDSSCSDSEIHPSLADQYIVAPVVEKHPDEDNDMACDDDTQEVEHGEETTTEVKEWINSRHTNTIDLADILSHFPDIPVVVTEDIIERLLKEGLLSKAGKDSYSINKKKELNSMACDVKQEAEMQDIPQTEKISKNSVEDYMYMKALYHALPMDYVTIGKLQNKLGGEATQNTVRKLIDKMTNDGYLKISGNKRLGKRVIHSEASNKKLIEVQRILEGKSMEIETDGHPFDFKGQDLPTKAELTQLMCENSSTQNTCCDQVMRDVSTCGGLHSIGSDLTRTRGRSETYQNGSLRSGQPAQAQGNNTPTSKAEPISSLESGVPGKENERAKSRGSLHGDDSNSQNKRSRKSSTVKEPILQYTKRQKSIA